MKEIWKDIKGYEGYYQVSNLGRVKSKYDKYARYGNKSNQKTKIKDDYNFIKPINIGNGYMRVRLSKNKKITNKMVHRLVAEAFIENYNNLPYVNHKDGNSSNNNVNNLEWCTAKENTRHAINNNLIKHNKIEMLDKNGDLLKIFNNRQEIEEYLNKKICQEQITRCCNKLIKTSYGYVWRYHCEQKNKVS